MDRTRRTSRLLTVIVIVATITVGAGLVITWSLYRSALENHRRHLAHLADSQAALLRAVARYDARSGVSDTREGAVSATLGQMREGWLEGAGFGETGEFLAGREQNGLIEFIGVNRLGEPLPAVPAGSPLGEPMQRALQGESGTLIGRDYAGREVLAAYHWIPELEIGLVAKMDLAEIQAPLWRSVLIGALILLGSLFIFLLGDRYERRLEERRARYLALFEGSPDGQLVLADMYFEEANERACEMWATPHDQVVGKTPLDFSPPVQPGGRPSEELAREKLAAARRGERPVFEWRHERADGTSFDAEITLKAVELRGDERIVATVRDITKRRSRQEMQERLLTVLQQTADGVGMADAEGNIFYINSAGRRLIGVGEDADVSRFTVADLQGDQVDPEQILETAAREGTWQGESHLRRIDGTSVAVSQVVTAHRDAQGELRYFSNIVRDISQRREAERRMRRLATAIEQINEGILITNADGVIEYVNEALTGITGYRRDELIGENPRILKSGHQDEAFYRAMWKTIEAGEVWQGHLVNRRKDGTFYEEEMTITPIRGPEGEIQNYVAAKHDTTERTVLESQLQQAQKMEAIGQLAGGVAHDFNNMLTGITGYAQLLLGSVDDEKHRSDLEQILELSLRAADLTQQLLAFSRRQQLEKVSVDLDKLVTSTLKMLRRLIPEDIEVEFVGADDLHTVVADSGQLVQVVMNLAVNARDAMPEGGALTIETSNVTLDEDYADIHLDVSPGRYVMLSISDTGVGIDDEIQEHIFEPFFTTKESGEGTGLGLATVYGIVKQHGGHIGVYSEPGMGTTFNVYLPAVETSETGDETARSADVDVFEEIFTVLLVEDDESVRDIVERTLSMIGCHVLSAGRSSEAGELYETSEQEIELLVTDVVMPGGLGTELYADLSAVDPDLKVIFMSGYPDRGASQLSNLPNSARFLRKPFEPSKLVQCVCDVMSNGGRGPSAGPKNR